MSNHGTAHPIQNVRAAILERLRFEKLMGVETLHPIALEERAPPATTVLSTPPARSPQPSSEAPAAASAAIVRPESAQEALSIEERWKNLEARAMACAGCVLHKARQKVVFGDGNKNARLVFVGEGPGADEDAQGKPFVGRAGQKLNEIITAMGLQREDVYICNVVKCRPPENRTPLPDEVGACSPFLTEQLELIAPSVIVALGSPAAKALLNTTQGIMNLRGRWSSYKGIPVMPTFHPAFLLRQYTVENRKAMWDDMQKVLKKLAETSSA
jgi:uracil-DNA glycosylase